MTGSTLLRAAGLLAVAGAVANGVADYLLQGGPQPGPGVDTCAQRADAPYDEVFLGGIVGNAAVPLWLPPPVSLLGPPGNWSSRHVPGPR